MHKVKEIKKLLQWVEKVQGCSIKLTKNGVMICPPIGNPSSCYTTHHSDTGVQAVMQAVGKWFGVRKHIVNEAFKHDITIQSLISSRNQAA
jgi:hypothetical protein